MTASVIIRVLTSLMTISLTLWMSMKRFPTPPDIFYDSNCTPSPLIIMSLSRMTFEPTNYWHITAVSARTNMNNMLS